MDWLNIIPLPVALGMVLYINNIVEKHEKNCPIHAQLKDINRKIDMILERMIQGG